MYTIIIDEKEYHAQPIYSAQVDSDDNLIILKHEPILDENGDLIESNICICAARENSECACGAWDIPLSDNDDYTYDDDY